MARGTRRRRWVVAVAQGAPLQPENVSVALITAICPSGRLLQSRLLTAIEGIDLCKDRFSKPLRLLNLWNDTRGTVYTEWLLGKRREAAAHCA